MARVTFLDDSEDLRLVMVSLIESRLRTSCLGLGSYAEMVERANEVLQSEIVILDLDLGHKKPSGIDAYQWLMQQGFRGCIYFLTGHGRSHPLMMAAEKSGARIWEKPTGSTHMLQSMSEQLRPPEAQL